MQVCRWAGRGTYPRAWQEMRQVLVPKASAEELSGEVSAADLRPIVIMSILWRVASSAIASCPAVQAWQAEVLSPDQYGGVHKRHIHHGLGRIAGRQAQGDPVVSLDFAKCFDHVDPKLACDLLAAAGFPSTIELNGCVQGRGHRVSSSLPQGDGLAPLALNVMLWAPCRHVASSFGSSLRQSVFLDDRAFTIEPRAVARVLSVWGLGLWL